MMTTQTITIAGAAGGVGTTTAAIAVALVNADAGKRVMLVTHDKVMTLAALGVCVGRRDVAPYVEAAPNVYVVDIDGPVHAWGVEKQLHPDLIVTDAGTMLGDAEVWCLASDYRSLTAASRIANREIARVAVWLAFDGSALGEREAADVLGLPVIEVHRTAAIARAFDAGVIVSRLPDGLRRLGEAISRAMSVSADKAK